MLMSDPDVPVLLFTLKSMNLGNGAKLVHNGNASQVAFVDPPTIDLVLRYEGDPLDRSAWKAWVDAADHVSFHVAPDPTSAKISTLLNRSARDLKSVGVDQRGSLVFDPPIFKELRTLDIEPMHDLDAWTRFAAAAEASGRYSCDPKGAAQEADTLMDEREKRRAKYTAASQGGVPGIIVDLDLGLRGHDDMAIRIICSQHAASKAGITLERMHTGKPVRILLIEEP